MSESLKALGPQGPFARHLDWFTVRDCQGQMAEAVESAILTNQVALVESGTGTGKTFAYLVPPLLNGKKTLISTRTKHLQEQLFQKDIPVVCEVLNLNPTVRILKGRSNYLCLLKYEHAQKNPDLLGFSRKFRAVYNWVVERDDGDISEYELHADERRQMTTTARTCVGSNCKHWNPCYANRARNAARQADVLVVNHNLLSLEMTHGDAEGEGSDAYGVEVVIVDEAHRFPDIACESLSLTVSKQRLDEFCENLEYAEKTADLDFDVTQSIIKSVSEATDQLDKKMGVELAQWSLDQFQNRQDLVAGYWNIVSALDQAVQNLDPHIDSSPEIEKCRDLAFGISEDAKTILERDNVEVASWVEKSRHGFSFHRLPLEPRSAFGPAISNFEGSWIFTSASMAVGDDYSHFEHSMGLSESINQRWDSPFDFENQALIYFPPNMPLPNYQSREEFDKRVVEVVEQLVPISKGRMLVLFTTIASMKVAKEYLAERIDYKLLCQYDRPNTRLLEEFKRDGNAVLLGTMGFWEGIDIKGDDLSCVIIDKLPFAPFDNPKANARRNLMEESGRSFFNDWQVPSAVLTLKQGSGRLIRDISDRGVLVLCDPRINQKSYGKAFLDSLPPMPRSDSLARVNQFFSS